MRIRLIIVPPTAGGGQNANGNEGGRACQKLWRKMGERSAERAARIDGPSPTCSAADSVRPNRACQSHSATIVSLLCEPNLSQH